MGEDRSDGPADSGDREGRPTRRRVLAATAGLAATTGLAGCPGGDGGPGTDDANAGGGGNGATDGGGTAGDGTRSGSVSCTSLTDGYRRFDAGETAVVAEFEYPAVLGDLEVQTVGAVLIQGRRPIDGADDGALALQYNQALEGDAEPAIEGTPEDSEELAIATTVDFGGERVDVVSNAAAETDIVGLTMSLPYDVDGETRYFFTQTNLSVVNTDDVTGDCGDALVAAARHVVDSLEPNPDSTIAQEQP